MIEPYYKDKYSVLYWNDCLKIIKELPDNSIDEIVTDPPYGYSFMGKDWDKVVIPIHYWRECLRVLKDGAFAFVMSAPRQDVLLHAIKNLSDAGFDTGFTSIYWSYASGFPKAMNIGKMVDKRGGHLPDELRNFKKWFRLQIEKSNKTQEQINKECGFTATSYYKTDGKDYWTSAFPTPPKWEKIKEVMQLSTEWDWIIKRFNNERGYIEPSGNLHCADETKSIKFSGKQLSNNPFTPQAQSLDGSYGGFQPKPAVEVIIVAMKPLSEKTYVDQALKNSKGITWLDKGRIPYENEITLRNTKMGSKYSLDGTNKNFQYSDGEKFTGGNLSGRFPANLLVSDDCLNDGNITLCRPHRCKKLHSQGGLSGQFNASEGEAFTNINDSGSFSRYFDLDRWWLEKIKQLPESVQKTFPFLICPKASKSEKNKGCEGLQERIVKFNQLNSDFNTDPRSKNGGYENNKKIKAKNCHPTVKPIKLMSYLITLGSQEGDVILDPFMGSGSTGIACKMLGRKFIGCDTEKEYCDISIARIKVIPDSLFKEIK